MCKVVGIQFINTTIVSVRNAPIRILVLGISPDTNVLVSASANINRYHEPIFKMLILSNNLRDNIPF